MSRIRVLVVEDSLTVRERLCAVLASDPGFAVVGEASDGAQAIELCSSVRPDVVSMDMMMPNVSGLAATEHIMAYCPTPILIVSASTNRAEVFCTYEALTAGAVDVLEKPNGTEPDGEWERKYLAAIRMVSRIRVITHPRARLTSMALSRGMSAAPSAAAKSREPYRVAALGASTGGPAALVQLLANVPAPCPLPILLVLHISDPFGLSFAEWLGGQTGHRAVLARSGDAVASQRGRIVMAPPGQHMLVERGRLVLTGDVERNSCRPSVDVLFESLAEEYGASCVACLLTGMGRDGAEGLLRVRRAGGLTMAQDEASCIVFGMPREAARLEAAMHVLPPGEMGVRIATAARLGHQELREP